MHLLLLLFDIGEELLNVPPLIFPYLQCPLDGFLTTALGDGVVFVSASFGTAMMQTIRLGFGSDYFPCELVVLVLIILFVELNIHFVNLTNLFEHFHLKFFD